MYSVHFALCLNRGNIIFYGCALLRHNSAFLCVCAIFIYFLFFFAFDTQIKHIYVYMIKRFEKRKEVEKNGCMF